MIGIIILTSIALLLGLLLVFTDNKLNNKVETIEKALPGYNCGTCGYGSCKGMATELLKNPEAYKKCKLLKDNSELLKILENKD